MPETTLGDWIQAGCAAVTLILALVTYWQGNKIKTLTDIVSSLEKQVSIAQELLSFEIKSRIKDAQPLFAPNRIVQVNDHYKLWLKNKGQKARHVRLDPKKNVSKIEILLPTVPTVLEHDLINFNFFLIDLSQEYSIEISFEDDWGDTFKQIVIGTGPKYRVKLPTE